jgi:DNA-binding response OmpR family regulator
MSAKGRKPDPEELAKRLRANLRRRKAQSRARQERGDATENGDELKTGDGK